MCTSVIKFFIGIIFQKMRMEEDKNVNKKFSGSISFLIFHMHRANQIYGLCRHAIEERWSRP